MYEVDRLLTGLTAQQKGTTAQWYSNKKSLWSYVWPLLDMVFRENNSDRVQNMLCLIFIL